MLVCYFNCCVDGFVDEGVDDFIYVVGDYDPSSSRFAVYYDLAVCGSDEPVGVVGGIIEDDAVGVCRRYHFLSCSFHEVIICFV